MIPKILEYLPQYFTDSRYKYHSLDHTMAVYQAAKEIAAFQKVESNEVELLQIAALFHDVGYSNGAVDHEEASASEARAFLVSQAYPEEKIKEIESLIMSTKMTVQPKGLLQSIIKDADVHHLGTTDFSTISKKLKEEKELLSNNVIPEEEWANQNLDFLSQHKWHSKGGKKLFNKTKKNNIVLLKEEIKKIRKQQSESVPSRGIETMYRVALRNHNQLSKIADNKANIMLSITAIMLSLILSSLAPKIDTNPRLMIPTILIILVNLITMFFAIMATRPKVTSAPYTREKLLNNEINLLFFGNFYKIPLAEFEWGMERLMEDKDLLYGSLSKDLYFLGVVLAKKYKYLQYAYGIFMIGLIVSTLSFIWVFMQM